MAARVPGRVAGCRGGHSTGKGAKSRRTLEAAAEPGATPRPQGILVPQQHSGAGDEADVTVRKRQLCGLLGTVSRTPSSARLLSRQQSRLISCQKTSQKGRSVDLPRFPLYVFPSFSTNKRTTANAHRAQPARSEHLHVLPIYLRRPEGHVCSDGPHAQQGLRHPARL